MAKLSQSYETVMVFSCKNEEAIPALVEKFTTLISENATVDSVEEWGKKRLAYPINYETEGYYVLMYMTAPADLPRELERNLQISESVLRYLVIRFEGPIPAKREPLKPFVAREAAPVEAAPAAEAPVAVEVKAEEADTEAPQAEIE